MYVDSLIINANLATMNEDFGFRLYCNKSNPYGQVINGALAIKNGKIVWLGTMQESTHIKANDIVDAQNKWITPALIDCHTHLVYAGNRSNEFESRLMGISYEDIAQKGGGILSTVNATRQSTFDELYKLSEKRLKNLITQGVATVEIKSGYGLNLETERKMLQVARKLGKEYNITVKTTYLAAHSTPEEYKEHNDEYIENVCEWLNILHQEGLVDAVDAFCEKIAFNTQQVRKLFMRAKGLGLPVKLHAEQLSDLNGGSLVAEFHGLSADHIEYLSQESIKKMAKSNTVGVLLPTAFYVLRERQEPPIESMRQAGIKMAVSTDCNPGTSPSTSILLAMNMACTLFRLTPEEALAGTTYNAAYALGLEYSQGKLAVGYDANLCIWNIDRPADLSYLIGQNPLEYFYIGGRKVLFN
ncbi:imidazolonepropionase [Vespertiliibacter pulmonis]|uniref:Imidazolonepropionase n=1 Tax=Vespertiliibacter pulmonis TaxID=1443036 RepID=A0A3N4VXA5_9PAST|nr:imidazolonepropionase [Vespertiliibacter pulmonis]RPE83671.1 imidazolonepropionase [Vespertiliibacter pulmonis]